MTFWLLRRKLHSASLCTLSKQTEFCIKEIFALKVEFDSKIFLFMFPLYFPNQLTLNNLLIPLRNNIKHIHNHTENNLVSSPYTFGHYVYFYV